MKENVLLENIHQCHQDLGILIPKTNSNGEGPACKKRKVDGSGDVEVDKKTSFPHQVEGNTTNFKCLFFKYLSQIVFQYYSMILLCLLKFIHDTKKKLLFWYKIAKLVCV